MQYNTFLPIQRQSIVILCLFCSLIFGLSSQTFAATADKTASTTQSVNTTNTENANNKQQSILPPPSISSQQVDDIKHFMPKQQQSLLLAGTDEVVTLFKASTLAVNHGVMILVPEWQVSAVEPKALHPLFEQLPTEGWSAFLVQPPEAPSGYPSQAATELEKQEQNQALIEAYQQQLTTIINTVLTQAESYPGAFIIVAQGNNAALIVELIQQQKIAAPSALILLSSYRATPAENQQFLQQLAQSSYPILDLALTRDNPDVLALMPQKKAVATKAMKAFYRQQLLNNIHASYYPTAALLKAINGWLKAIGY
jgi:hypothetical protein